MNSFPVFLPISDIFLGSSYFHVGNNIKFYSWESYVFIPEYIFIGKVVNEFKKRLFPYFLYNFRRDNPYKSVMSHLFINSAIDFGT